MKKQLLIILLLFFFISTKASNIIIECKDSSIVHVYEISDYLTNTEKYINSFNVSPELNTINIKIEKTTQYIFKKNNIRYHLFIEPNFTYKIKLKDLVEQDYKEYLRQLKYPVSIIKPKKNINRNLQEIDIIISDFYFNHEELILYKKGIITKYKYSKKDSVAILKNKEPLSYYFKILEQKLYKIAEKNNSDFFKESVKFKIANQELKLFKKSKKHYYTKYIENQKTNLSNPYYINFINSSYENYAFTSSFYKYEQKAFNYLSKKDLAQFDLLFKNNVFFEDNILRSFIEIITLKKYFDQKIITSKLYIELLDLYLEKNISKEINTICKNLKDKEVRISKGDKINSIIGVDQFNDSIKIPYSNTKRYYYINFITENCQDCPMQIKALKTIKKTYGKWINFITIYIGEKKEEYNRIKKENTFYWPFIFTDLKSQKIINDFKISGSSAYLVLNKTGEIELYPANKPMDENIMNTIYPKMEKIMLSLKKEEF